MAFSPNESQQKVLQCRDHLCVIAGAGSGKTGTLVETLVVRLAESFYESGVNLKRLDITDILALTFTDKAAAELRQRLSAAFGQKRRETEGDEAEFWRLQAARLDRADIGTIHGYALKLVRENALSLGLAASPRLDEDDRAQAADLAHIITDWLDEENPDLLGLLEYYSLPVLTEILDKCATRLSAWGLAGLTADLTPVRPLDGDLAAFRSLAMETGAWITGGGLNPAKPYYHKALSVVEALIQILAKPGPQLAVNIDEILLQCQEALAGSGNWYAGTSRKAELSDALAGLRSLRHSQLAIPLKEKLLRLTDQLADRLTARKKRRGSINFDDILILARRLLATRPEVRKREIQRRRLILIDEFQDTNRLQADILAYLLLNPDDDRVFPEGGNLWRDLHWEKLPPRFSAFGDLKQSIYRFRGAEVEVMAELRRALESGGGRVLALDRNYRSQEPLIDFFNTLFPSRLGPETFTALDRQRPAAPALYQGPHVVQLRTSGVAPRLAAERLELQAAVLARYLDDIFQGRRQVLVRDHSGTGRPPGPGDVAVLFRSRKGMARFKEVLGRAGWDCRLAAGNDPFDYAEVRGLLAAFQYLSGFDEEVSLVSLLRSPLGPVSDQGLLGLVWPSGGGGPVRLSAYFSGPGLELPENLAADDYETLAELRQLLGELRLLVGRVPPVEILERLVEQRRLIPLAATEPDGGDRARAITTFLALSRSLGRNREHQPLSPAEEMMDLCKNWDRRQDGGEVSPEGEAVTLMTVHGAKGLEYPVVIIAQADAKPRTQTDQALISAQGVLAVNYKSWPEDTARPFDYQAVRAEEEALDEMENGRLLYVAATRARDHLVFLGWPKTRKEKGAPPPDSVWLEALLNRPEAAALTSAVEYDPDEVGEWFDARSGRTGLESGGELPSDHAEPSEAGPALLEPMRLTGQALAVTALGQLLADPESFYREKHLGLDRDLPGLDWRPGRPFFGDSPSGAYRPALAPTEAGSLFHAVLEHLDPLRPQIDELVRHQAARLGLDLEEAEIEAITAKVQIFLDGPVGSAWRGALAAGRPDYRELPFQMEILYRKIGSSDDESTLTVTGVIDLFFLTPEGEGRIVDYKLAAFHQGPELAAYENQVRLYGQALRSAGFDRPLRACLYFAGGGEPVIHQVSLPEDRPIEPLIENLGLGLKFLNQTRPMRPNRPGPHDLW